MSKIEVFAMKYSRDNMEEIQNKLGFNFLVEIHPGGNVKVPGTAYPLVEGDWIIKEHKRFIVVSDEYFKENYKPFKEGTFYNTIKVEKRKDKALEKLNGAIKHFSKLPYTQERDFIIHNLQKAAEAGKQL